MRRHGRSVLQGEQLELGARMMSPSDDRITEIRASVQDLRATLRDAHGNMETTSRQFADWRSHLMTLESELRQLEDRR
jgi:predicted  nucleic acid-binding Zn-ribbon protein